MITIPYATAKGLIKEADVLLFKASKFPGVGWWIGKYTQSPYSHAGLAHWEDGKLYCLEFREFKGSRMYPMDNYIQGRQVDVFRAAETVIRPAIKVDDYDGKTYLAYEDFHFTDDIADSITATAKQLIGKKYSYWTIWQMFKTYIPFVRLGRKVIKNGEPETKKFVCSTLVTYAYRVNYIDPVPFLSDGYTSPGDLARSGLFSMLFSVNN
jgi:hypothetical protein